MLHFVKLISLHQQGVAEKELERDVKRSFISLIRGATDMVRPVNERLKLILILLQVLQGGTLDFKGSLFKIFSSKGFSFYFRKKFFSNGCN